MANSNQLVAFATATGANVYSPTTWAASPVVPVGFQSGIADPTAANTAIRQAMFTSAMIGQFTADFGPGNVLDNGNIPAYEAQFEAALQAYISTFGSAAAIPPFSSTNDATQTLSNNVETTVSPGSSGTSVIGTLSSGTFTFTRTGVYSVFMSMTGQVVTSAAAQVRSQLFFIVNGGPGGGNPGDESYVASGATSIFNLTTTLALYCPSGTTLNVKALLQAASNFTSAAVTSCGLQVAVIL